MPIQQMLLGGGAKLDPPFEMRVIHSVTSNTNPEFIGRGTMRQVSDGTIYWCFDSENLANVRSGSGRTLVWFATNTAFTGIGATCNNWGSTYQAEAIDIYPYRGSSDTMLIGTVHGYYAAYSSDDRTPLWIFTRNNRANGMTTIKNVRWFYPGYYTASSFRLSYTGTGDWYWFLINDYNSGSNSSGSNIRVGKLEISTSGVVDSDSSNLRHLGAGASNGTVYSSWTNDESDTDIIYINCRTYESPVSGGTGKSVLIKYSNNNGIVWQRNYYNGTTNSNYGYVCEHDSSGNIYHDGIINKNSQMEPVIFKHNSSGTRQWARTFTGNSAPVESVSSVMINNELFVLYYKTGSWTSGGDNGVYYLIKINTSDGTIAWQNKLSRTSTYTMYHWSLMKDKDNNIGLQIKLISDSGSVIHGQGCALITGIQKDGSTGSGSVGPAITYSSTNFITMTGYNIDDESSTWTTAYSFSEGQFNDYTGSEINTNNTAQQFVNINDA